MCCDISFSTIYCTIFIIIAPRFSHRLSVADPLFRRAREESNRYSGEGDENDRQVYSILNTALLAACMLGERSDAEFLLQHGANSQCVDEQIRTPLHFACKVGDLQLLSLLSD